MATASTATEKSPGLIESAKRYLLTWLALLQTRLEIFSGEIEEQRQCLSQIVLLGIVSLFCLSFSLFLLTLFVVVFFWDTHRFVVLGAFTLLYLAAGILAAARMRRKARNKPKFLAVTLAELSKDYKHLSS